MLPTAARLTRGEDIRAVTRRGRRIARPRIVVHALAPSELVQTKPDTRVGFVVSRSVGNSVVRHRVLRRLRHVARDRLGTLVPGSSLVIRALPPAAEASSAEFGQDLDVALRRLRLTAVDHDGGAE